MSQALKKSQILHYLIDAVYFENSTEVIYRVICNITNKKYLLKSYKMDLQSSKSQLEKDMDLLKNHNWSCLPTYIDHFIEGQACYLTMSYIDGASVADSIKDIQLDFQAFYSVSSAILSALEELHGIGWVLLDFDPTNLIWDRQNNKIQFVSFSMCAKTAKDGVHLTFRPSNIVYCSPEQTGRANRSLDERSDLYVLGMILYSILANQLPIDGKDTLKWIHFHMAFLLPELSGIFGEAVDKAIYKIINRLTSKAKENRYQSCSGVRYDLNSLSQKIQSSDDLSDFSVGTQDHSNELVLSQKLYGRDHELQILHQSLENTEAGELCWLFIKGNSGIGKTALIQEFLSQVDTQKYVFVSGKYQLLQKSEYFKGLIEACEQILDKKILLNNDELSAWIAKIQSIADDELNYLESVLPKLRSVLISDRTRSADSLKEFSKRTRQEAFTQFLRASATSDNPLILFLDDIQWFDESSSEWLMQINKDSDLKSVLIICAYRAEEVDAAHRVSYLKKNINKASMEITEIDLKPISTDEIGCFLQDSLVPTNIDIFDLSNVLYKKTGGNPFFVKQMLFALFDQKILKRNNSFSWNCEIQEVNNLPFSKNVIELLSQKISSLNIAAQKALIIISCFTDKVSKDRLLNLFYVQNELELSKALQQLETEGLIYLDTHQDIVISHDKIRETAYQLESVFDKKQVHRSIGLDLLQGHKKEDRAEDQVACAFHLNNSIDLNDKFDLRFEITQLNYKLAVKAHQVGAFELSLSYAKLAQDYLTEGEQKKETQLIWDLNVIRGQCEFLIGHTQEARDLFSRLSRQKISSTEKAKMYLIYGELLHSVGLYQQSNEIMAEALSWLGVNISLNPGKIRILLAVFKNQFLLKKMGFENVSALPKVEDQNIFLIQKLLVIITGNSYFCNKLLYAYSVTKLFYYILKYGVHPETAQTGLFYSVFIAHKFKKYNDAYKLSESVISLSEKYGGRPFYGRGGFAFGAFLQPWVKTVEESNSTLEKLYLNYKLIGDAALASYCPLYLMNQKIYSGQNLKEIQESIKPYIKSVKPTSDPMTLGSTIATFVGLSDLTQESPSSFLDDLKLNSKPDEIIQEILEKEMPNPKAWYGNLKLLSNVLMLNYESALRFLPYTDIALEATPYSISIAYLHAFRSMAIIESKIKDESSLPIKLDRKDRLKVVESLKLLALWSNVQPTNFMALFKLTQAAVKKGEGKLAEAIQLYFTSASMATETKNLMLKAYANESAARIFLMQKNKHSAYMLLAESARSYKEWGFALKYNQLISEFPSLVGVLSEVKNEQIDSQNQKLDILSVLKSCQLIGNEIDLNKLLKQIAFLLNENAGAEIGKIFLKENDQFVLKARSQGASAEQVQITNDAVKQVDDISHSILNYVIKTQEPLVISDAQNHELTRNDSHAKSNGLKSILCMPIVNKTQLVGLVWLENNSSVGVFTPQRLETLKVLANQAAISFENARLFYQEQEKLRMEGELQIAKTVQNTLFKESDGHTKSFKISGSFEPASECGGDWWHYGNFGELDYFCIGDATGHGVPAALITSAVRSAVASVEFVKEKNPEYIVSLLNNSVAQTSKGQINMTLFMGFRSQIDGTFQYANCSHEPALYLPSSWIAEIRNLAKSDKPSAIKKFRQEVTLLHEISGASLGARIDGQFKTFEIKVSSGDLVVCYTDGITEMRAKDGNMMGDRLFLTKLAESLIDNSDPATLSTDLRKKWHDYRQDQPLNDDVTFFIVQF